MTPLTRFPDIVAEWFYFLEVSSWGGGVEVIRKSNFSPTQAIIKREYRSGRLTIYYIYTLVIGIYIIIEHRNIAFWFLPLNYF